MKNKFYKPAGKYVEFPCYIETSLEGFCDHVTMEKLLNDTYAEYTPAIIKVPEELRGYVLDDGFYNFNSPTPRLEIIDRKAYFTIVKTKDDGKGGVTWEHLTVVCPVTEK